uniref:Metalloendopeptidase n=1 Tax=Panagrellus redivivus TaxID=6233 RepID=A0A7E4V562_PANRE
MMALLLFYVGLICVFAIPGNRDLEAPREVTAAKLERIRKLQAERLAREGKDQIAENLIQKLIRPRKFSPKFYAKSSTPSIPMINEKYTDVLYDGDIRLTNQQLDEMINELDGGRKFQNRGQIKYPYYMWNKAMIPYYFDESLPDSEARDAVRQAIKYYEEHTCLRFKELDYPVNGLAMIEFGNDDTGCNSLVGRWYYIGAQRINLGIYCRSQDIILHEIGHALGFVHTQMRPDSGSYVKPLDDNLRARYSYAFRPKFHTIDQNYSYDYMSIMHYPETAFQTKSARRQNLPTLYALIPYYQHLMGTTTEPSFIDLAMLNKFYRCEESCPRKLACSNGGYQNYKKCDECVCATGFTGPHCRKRAGSENKETDCGGYFQAVPQWTTLESNVTSKCTWWIIADENKYIQVQFQQYTGAYSTNCLKGGLELRFADRLVEGFRICQMPSTPTYVSFKRTVIINGYAEDQPQYFRLRFRQVDTTTTRTDTLPTFQNNH